MLKAYERLTKQGKLLPMQTTLQDLQAAYSKEENRVIDNAKALKMRMTSVVKSEQRAAITVAYFVTEDYSKRLAEAGQVDCAQIKAVTSFSSFQRETEHMEC
ncbi:hypothetical protein QR680_004819 [Steinernema hermaphroditum]|nr:hypothetical protein QR680_004819 [Steinernema hermaphroditum]